MHAVLGTDLQALSLIQQCRVKDNCDSNTWDTEASLDCTLKQADHKVKPESGCRQDPRPGTQQ